MPRVLIADDHPFLLAGVRAVLEATDMEVVAAVGHGDDALAAIAQHDPEVVVLDINMPGRDGISVLEAMRDSGDRRPVILLTAQLGDAQLVAALRAGVNGILGKQGGSRMLVEAIGIVLQGGAGAGPGPDGAGARHIAARGAAERTGRAFPARTGHGQSRRIGPAQP